MQYIYRIMNLCNGKIYVGKSVDPTYRWKQHQHLAMRGDSRPLYASLRKYGVQNFDFNIVQQFEKLEEAYAAEIYWINFWQTFKIESGYNLTKGGLRAQDFQVTEGSICARRGMPDSMKKKLSAMLKGRKLSPEVIEHMRIAQRNRKRKPITSEQHERLRNAQLGKVLSDEHKEKIRQSLIGRKKSEDHVQKVILARKRNGPYKSANRLPDQVYRDIRRLLNDGRSRKQIIEELDVSYSVICRVEQNKVYWVDFNES